MNTRVDIGLPDNGSPLRPSSGSRTNDFNQSSVQRFNDALNASSEKSQGQKNSNQNRDVERKETQRKDSDRSQERRQFETSERMQQELERLRQDALHDASLTATAATAAPLAERDQIAAFETLLQFQTPIAAQQADVFKRRHDAYRAIQQVNQVLWTSLDQLPNELRACVKDFRVRHDSTGGVTLKLDLSSALLSGSSITFKKEQDMLRVVIQTPQEWHGAMTESLPELHQRMQRSITGKIEVSLLARAV